MLHSNSTKTRVGPGFFRRASLCCLALVGLFTGSASAQTPCQQIPAFDSPPTSVTVYTSPNNCHPVVSYLAKLLDSAGVNLSFTATGATIANGNGFGIGLSFNRGITHVTLTATSDCGTATHAFDVTIKDTSAPNFIAHPNITVNSDPGLCGAYVPYSIPVANDNCPDCSGDLLQALGFTFLGNFGGHTYYRTPGRGFYSRADSFAGNLGANLIAINSYAEDSFIHSVIPDTQLAWIGFTDRDTEGVWKWTNGDPVTYTNWCNDQPDDYLHAQNVAYIHTGLAGPPNCWDDAHPTFFPLGSIPNNMFGIVELNTCNTGLVRTRGLDSGAFFPIGTTVVTYMATDASGNVDSISFTVTVLGGNAGTCSIGVTPSNNTFTGGVPTNLYIGYGPQSATLTASGGPTTTYLWSGPTSKLSCTTCKSPVFTPTAAGNYTFTVTTTNTACNATSTCSVTFCVKDIRVPGNGNGNGNNAKVYLCHVPPGNPANAHTLSISVNAVPAHLGNHDGDRLGTCDQLCATTARYIVQPGNSLSDEVEVHPNPTSNIFYVDIPYFENEATVTITDIQGRLIQKRSLKEDDAHTQRFELNDLNRGIYILDVNYDGTRYRTKILLQ